MDEVLPGKYRHFKGKMYEVLGTARHSETLDEFVVYRALFDSAEFGKNALWVRPKVMFCGMALQDGKEVKRFERVSD